MVTHTVIKILIVITPGVILCFKNKNTHMNSYMCAHMCANICAHICVLVYMCVQIYRHTFGLKSDRCMHAQSHTMTTVNHMRISYNEVTYDNRVCKHYSNMFTHLYILIWVHIYEYTYINTHISVHIRVHILVYSYMCKYIHSLEP